MKTGLVGMVRPMTVCIAVGATLELLLDCCGKGGCYAGRQT